MILLLFGSGGGAAATVFPSWQLQAMEDGVFAGLHAIDSGLK